MRDASIVGLFVCAVMVCSHFLATSDTHWDLALPVVVKQTPSRHQGPVSAHQNDINPSQSKQNARKHSKAKPLLLDPRKQKRWSQHKDESVRRGRAEGTSKRDPKRPKVVFVPWCGTGNRMRGIVDAQRFNQCSLKQGRGPVYVAWVAADHHNSTFKSLFSSPVLKQVATDVIAKSSYSLFTPTRHTGVYRQAIAAMGLNASKVVHHVGKVKDLAAVIPPDVDYAVIISCTNLAYRFYGCAKGNHQDVVRQMKPSAEVEQMMQASCTFLRDGGRPVIGVHLRSGDKAQFAASDDQMVEKLRGAAREAPDARIYVASEHAAGAATFKKAFGGTVFSLNASQHIDRGRGSTTGAVIAVADMLCLAYADKIYTSVESSFSFFSVIWAAAHFDRHVTLHHLAMYNSKQADQPLAELVQAGRPHSPTLHFLLLGIGCLRRIPVRTRPRAREAKTAGNGQPESWYFVSVASMRDVDDGSGWKAVLDASELERSGFPYLERLVRSQLRVLFGLDSDEQQTLLDMLAVMEELRPCCGLTLSASFRSELAAGAKSHPCFRHNVSELERRLQSTALSQQCPLLRSVTQYDLGVAGEMDGHYCERTQALARHGAMRNGINLKDVTAALRSPWIQFQERGIAQTCCEAKPPEANVTRWWLPLKNTKTGELWDWHDQVRPWKEPDVGHVAAFERRELPWNVHT